MRFFNSSRLVSWHKLILILAGGLVGVYAIGIILYVPFTPDIGIRCAFSPTVKRVHASLTDQLPAAGDTLVQVGNFQFPEKKSECWAQVLLLRELNLRSRSLDEQALGLQKRQEENQDWSLVNFKGETILKQNSEGEKFVLVRFRVAGNDQLREVWSKIGRLPLHELGPSILWFVLKLGLFGIGALVIWKRPGDRSASQFFLLCCVTVVAYMGGYHWARIATEPVLIMPFMVCAVLLPAVTLHFYMIFPRVKKVLLQHPHWSKLIIYGIPAIFLLVIVAGYFHLRAVRDETPEVTSAAWDIFSGGASLTLKISAIWYLASVFWLIHSYQTAVDATERNQVKWILLGAVVALVPISYTLYLLFWERDDFGTGAATWPMFAVSVCFTVAFAVSITRYRLMQVDQLVSSGMVYFVISFLAGLVYYAVVIVGMLVSVVKEPSLKQALFVSATALVLLLVLDIVRSRFKKALDRRFDRQKYQLDMTLQRLGEAIEQLVDPPTLARRLLDTSSELMNVTYGAIYLADGDPPIYRLVSHRGNSPPPLLELTSGCPLVEGLQSGKRLTTRSGMDTDPAIRQLKLLRGEVGYALSHEDKMLAFLILGPKELGWYGPGDFNILGAFAQFTALALASANGHRTIEFLNRDLHNKVEKISEQQRRILVLQSQLMRQSATDPVSGRNGSDPDLLSGAANKSTSSAHGIIGSSRAMRHLLDMIRRAAMSPSAVLITGESGTGKELLARAVHENSPRAGKPYVKVHCAALSPTLLESELFGHVKGAFTGAHKDKIGRFEMANGGTLFLDEIGDVSLEVQTKLLRVLQEKSFERVGSSEPVEVDVRVITATHQNLEELIRKDRFRKDLYFRLKVIPLTVPPLRQRAEDISELALHFLKHFAERSHKAVTHIDDDAMILLKSYAWPGNIRELENVIERAVVVVDGSTITPAELPPEFTQEKADWQISKLLGAANCDAPDISSSGLMQADREEFSRREQERLVRALAAADGNKAEAARALGLARSTLVSRLKKYGLS